MILYLLLMIQLALATSKLYVEGVIIAFDEKTVTLKQERGAILKVPRSSLVKNKGIAVGKDKVILQVRPSEFVKMNPKVLPKEPAKK
ncbi:hypothetical protein K2X05_14905 [bacterium]|nr:hypothetical protein [bacterium]